ncbi:MAG: large repetitive protein, partial [Humisphaera sp.]|nr:large repetitive protein [Humisphaera sp.]
MAENYPADPANPNLPPQQPDPSAAPAPAPKRRRKRWPWVIVGILLFLILLVALAPTLISTGPGKSFIVGKVNSSLNGKLDVADLSIGWLSGVTLNGVKIDDQQGRRVLEIASVRVPISLIGAARGKYDLGETVIDKPNLVNLEIYEDGSTNLGKLMKDSGGNATPPAAPPDQTSPQPTQPTKIPDVKGKITINQARATVSGPAVRSPIHLESGDVVVNIPNINSEIANDAKFVYRVGQSPPGTITIVGAIDAIENNLVNVDKLAADEKIQITSADLAGIEPFLQSPGAKTTLAGIASGALQLKSAGFQSCGLDGQLAVTNFAYGGDALKGDIYKSSNVALPISIATSSAGADTLIKIQTLKLETDHALVDLSGEATRGALTNLAKREKPGAKGQLALAVNTKDMPGLFNLLRNTLGLQKDVKITSGEFKTRVEVALTPENAVVKQSLYAVAAGQNGTQPVKLEPVYLDTAVSIPDIGDLAVHLKSGFATINGSGASLASLNIKGDADLGRLRSQIGQFTDLGKLDLSGTADFEVISKGDLRKPESESDLSAILNLRNVIVRGLEGKPEINQPRVALVTTATLVSGREGGETVDHVKTA